MSSGIVWNEDWNRDHFATVRVRYIARNQLYTTLTLFPELCLRVLDEYGCATEVIPNPNPPWWGGEQEEHSVVVASWPLPTSERAHYAYSLLPRMVEKILELTEESDACVAADALGKLLEETK